MAEFPNVWGWAWNRFIGISRPAPNPRNPNRVVPRELEEVSSPEARQVSIELVRRITGNRDYRPDLGERRYSDPATKRDLVIERGMMRYIIRRHRVTVWQRPRVRDLLGRRRRHVYKGWYCVATTRDVQLSFNRTMYTRNEDFPAADQDLAIWLFCKYNLPKIKTFPWHAA